MAKNRTQKENGSIDIFKIIVQLEEALGIDSLRRKLHELSKKSLDGTESDDVRDIVVMEVCRVFKFKKKDLIDHEQYSGYSSGEDKQSALMILCHILNKEIEENKRYSIVRLSKFLRYDASTIYKRIITFKKLNRNDKFDSKHFEKYDKIMESLKTKKIIK